MYCRECGTKFQSENAAICLNCGVAKEGGSKFCPNYGVQTLPNANACTNCGAMLNGVVHQQNVANPSTQKSKIVAGLLAIFVGAYGVHNFYLGYNTKAIIQVSISGLSLLLSICTVGISLLLIFPVSIWALIEGIMILTGSIKVDGKGNPLKD